VEQGFSEAQYNLGGMYFHGKGVAQDYNEAAKLYLKAAEQGHPEAQYNLLLMYGKGKGLPQSNKNAYIWSSIAASNGVKQAKKIRDILVKNLEPSTLVEAREKIAYINKKISSKLK
jgi:hypothetical protein